MSHIPEHKIVKGLVGSSASFYIAKKLTENELQPPALIVTPTLKDAENITEELGLFLPKELFNIITLKPWDVKPYDLLTPHNAIVSERLHAFWQLLHGSPIVVAPITALLQKVIPSDILEHSKIKLETNQTINLNEFKKQLLSIGYKLQEQVLSAGDLAIRGNIIDVFPPNSDLPVRVELFGDDIEVMRFFHSETQRSDKVIGEFILIPNREVLLTDKCVELASKKIKEMADSVGIQKPERDKWISQLRDGVFPRDVDSLLPFFFESLDHPLDYLPENGMLIIIDESKITEEIEKFEVLVQEGFENGIKDLRLVPPKESLYINSKEFAEKAGKFKTTLQIESLKREDLREGLLIPTSPLTEVSPVTHRSGKDPLSPFINHIKKWKYDGNHIIIVSHTNEQLTRLREILALHNFELRVIDAPIFDKLDSLSGGEKIIYAALGFISKGFEYTQDHLVLIAEEEIFGVSRKRRAPKASPGAAFFTSLEELKDDDLVVHIEHGIGKYGGLHQIKHRGQKQEFLLIIYKDEDRLYLPVHRVNLLQKYIGHEKERPPLDQLGSQAWEKRRKKVKKGVEELAHELLKLYAQREMARGYKFSAPDNNFLEFESEFEFEETEDQAQAIDDVIDDMCKHKPMDRLICGDVGYGKTEVAMRAAFKAVLDHKQVAVVCPTTLLASQHERTFKGRLAQFPVTIELLSRFKTPSEQKKILGKLFSGEVDIIIGTHALFSKDVKFKNLGLIVIDEEQRFGVKQKEGLKIVRTEVDVLTLTATPIPRTLSFTLSGLRDLSTINTPPADRRTVQTFVTPFHEEIIRNAILEEIKRGGQVFFVHNRVQTINSVLNMLENLVPEAKYGIAHGQLAERALEKVMAQFLNEEIDVLICSTIIESGLDIPTANTLIVNRADAFGLAQLYQLRGRVGRAKDQAFAYFLIPADQTITEEAQKRLEVLERYTDFGSGFRIASHDLEIRGGGDILGREQSGHIAAIGFEFYTKLLNEAIKNLRGAKIEPTIEPEIHINVTALLPESYIAETRGRLTVYKRLALASSDDDLERLSTELKDRFGEIPVETKNLISIMRIKIRLQTLHVTSITETSRGVVLEFAPSTKISHEKVMTLISKMSHKYQLKPTSKLVIIMENTNVETIKNELDILLQTLL